MNNALTIRGMRAACSGRNKYGRFGIKDRARWLLEHQERVLKVLIALLPITLLMCPLCGIRRIHIGQLMLIGHVEQPLRHHRSSLSLDLLEPPHYSSCSYHDRSRITGTLKPRNFMFSRLLFFWLVCWDLEPELWPIIEQHKTRLFGRGFVWSQGSHTPKKRGIW